MVDVMGVESNKHFVKSFREQGFTDSSFEPWKRRRKKDSRRGGLTQTVKFFDTDLQETYSFKRRKADVASVKNRAILVKSGNLRRSIKWRKYGKNAVINYSNLPYAKVHNDGLRAGRGKGFKMPKRQFVGYSKVMNKKIVEKINKIIRRTYK